MLEAFVNHVPIATTNSTSNGAASLVVAGQKGFVVKSNPEDVASGILFVLRDGKARSKMGAITEDFAQAHDWSVVANKLLAAYGGILVYGPQ